MKTILVAPLNWGLGHATRCIPIIRTLLDSEYKVIIASDGPALALLEEEFPRLEHIELPSYNITYPKNGSLFKLKMLLKMPHIIKTIDAENKVVQKLVEKGSIQGIISDNRLGVRHEELPSVYMTHQLNVLSGSTSFFSSKAHRSFIKKFDECWVPDIEGWENLSGKLSVLKYPDFHLRYIGPLSRMQKESLPKKYDILCLLSGPEPQRSLLETKLTAIFKNSSERVFLVRGVVEPTYSETQTGNLKVINYLTSDKLQTAINSSKIVIARSGYTTIMDLSALEAKAFFIPTPGQYEQEYLAKRLSFQGIVPSCQQKDFSEEKLQEIENYTGLGGIEVNANLERLFGLFEGK